MNNPETPFWPMRHKEKSRRRLLEKLPSIQRGSYKRSLLHSTWQSCENVETSIAADVLRQAWECRQHQGLLKRSMERIQVLGCTQSCWPDQSWSTPYPSRDFYWCRLLIMHFLIFNPIWFRLSDICNLKHDTSPKQERCLTLNHFFLSL